jgi:1-acyl-sn-glycerol-3-phosphate acyltransferase
VRARAKAVRRVVEVTREDPNAVVIVAPEGRDNLEGGNLAPPPPGVGRFLLLLAERGLPVLPVGGWESDGALNVHFGRVYTLAVPPQLRADDKDKAATEIVMSHLAALLPAGLRGPYSPPDQPGAG